MLNWWRNEELQKILKQVYLYLFAIFCAIIPFNNQFIILPTIFLVILTLLFSFVVKKKDFEKLRRPSFYALVSYFLYAAFLTFISLRIEDNSMLIHIFSIVLICVLWITITHYKLVLRAFVIGAFLLSILSSILIIQFIIEQNTFEFTAGGHINRLLLGERPYIGFIYIMSAAISLYLGRLEKKYIYYAIGVFFILFVIFISARMAIFSLLSLVIVSILYFRKSIRSTLYVLVSSILIVGSMLILNENLKKRLWISSDQNSLAWEDKIKLEPRFHIWECAISLDNSTQQILFGRGFKEVVKDLTSCYQQRTKFYTDNQKNWFINSKFNTHNQYLDIYFSLGILALGMFIIFLFFLFLENRKDFLATSLWLFLVLFLCTENLMHRQLGNLLIALVIVFIYFLKELNIENKELN